MKQNILKIESTTGKDRKIRDQNQDITVTQRSLGFLNKYDEHNLFGVFTVALAC